MSTSTQHTTAAPETTVLGYSLKDILAATAVLGIGGGGFTADKLDSKILEKLDLAIQLPHPVCILGSTAIAGAIIAFGYSLYHNNWKLELPRVTSNNIAQTISLASWGFLDEVAFGALFAVLAAYAKMPEAPYLVPENGIALVICSALAGARMRMANSDSGVLRDALAIAVGRPKASEQVVAKVKLAKTALEAARAALAPTSTASNPTAASDPTTMPNPQQLFNTAAIRERLIARGLPIQRDGVGLTLATLAAFSELSEKAQGLLKNYRLNDVAEMDNEAFLALAKSAATGDAAQLKADFSRIRASAVAAKAALKEETETFQFPI